MSSEGVKAAKNSVRVIASWCAERVCSKHVAVLIALEDGYYLSCRHFDQYLRRYVEFWGYFRERGEFHDQDEADRWAVEYFRRPMHQSFGVSMVECAPEFLAEMRQVA
jgi:hypothetical protein